MSKTYTVQEVSKLTLLTVRTLHYYDEINLLKANRLKNGHRYYLENDLIRLQQIITFKYLGFSLSKIKKILHSQDFNMIELMKMQHNALIEEEQRIKKVLNLFNYLINQYEHDKQINWETIIKIIEIIELKKDGQDKWYETLLTNNELDMFKKVSKQRTNKWIYLFKEIKANVNLNPKSKAAVKLVKKWHVLAEETYSNCPELKNKLWEAYKSGVIPGIPYDSQVTTFLINVTDLFNKFKAS